MYTNNKYARPFCNKCKVIWGKTNIGLILKCTKCGQPLVLKSFNPWIVLLKGTGIISLGATTVLFSPIPIVWIGGFLWGCQIIINGYKQWKVIKVLDGENKQAKEFCSKKYNDKNIIIITCGKCFKRLKFTKGKGTIKARCPHCLNRFRIST